MQVSLKKSAFVQGMHRQQGVVDRKTTVPVLNHVLLQAKKDSGALGITGTDLELGLTEDIQADVQKPGALAVPAHLLYDIARKCADDAPIELSHDAEKNILILSSAGSRFQLPILAADQYPALPPQEDKVQFFLTGAELGRLLDQTRFAMSQEEARFYLNGVYLHTGGHQLKMAGTDAHRLSLSWIPLPPSAEELSGVILSRKTVSELKRLIESQEGDIQLSFSNTQGVFQAGKIKLYTRFVNGTFPQYEQAIPRETRHTLVFQTAPFYQALDRVSVIASQEKSCPVKITLEKGQVVFSAQDLVGGQSRETLKTDYKGQPFDVKFNARYVLDALNQVRGETFSLSFNDPDKPFVIKDSKDEQVLYVLMPMRG